VRPGQVQRFPAAGDGRLAELDATLVLFTAESPPPLPPAATRLLDGEGYGPAARTLGGAAYAEIGAAVAELAAEYARTDHPLGVDLLRHLLAALLLRLARLPGDGLPAGEPAGEPAGGEVFRAFRRAVERGFAAGVPGRDVEGYAHRVGCSARTLTRACRAATGRSAKEYLDARVALEAKRLLAHTALPVAAVGRRLGFAEATNFGKFFRREAGVTPGAFRDEHGAAA
jgi:AraC-like DNA-binding protein